MVRTAAEMARAAMAHTTRGPQELLRTWDKGGKPFRFAILARFCERCVGMTEEQLEKFFGNGASLVLTRFCAWLRVTFGQGDSLSTQILRAIQVFISPVSSTRFVIEFVEQGGALSALEHLAIPEGFESTKVASLEVLLTVAQAGPKFVVVLRECEAEKYVNRYIDGDGKDKELAQDLLKALAEEQK
eukprot:m.243071 g.243071  ORF g.243071 m.243071 type:complete len:187 (+) comp15834_c1_seq1:1460-2020(+)